MNHSHTTRLLAALMLLSLAACRSGDQAAFVPPASWEGRQVHSDHGSLRLLSEPGGTLAATLPPQTQARVTGRQVDEAGIIWLQLRADSLAGWAPQDLLSLSEGEGGHIATH